MSFEDDEQEIRKITNCLDEKKDNKWVYGREWAKYKGNVINRLVIKLLTPYIDNCKIAEPNAFIRDNPTEFDILILKQNSNPINDYSNAFEKNDVLAIIEVKKNGFFYKKDEAENKIGAYVDKITNIGIPFFYITIRETKNYRDFTKKVFKDKKLTNNCFFLKVSESWEDEEWGKFVNAINSSIRTYS